jgi:hypothetical protein
MRVLLFLSNIPAKGYSGIGKEVGLLVPLSFLLSFFGIYY